MSKPTFIKDTLIALKQAVRLFEKPETTTGSNPFAYDKDQKKELEEILSRKDHYFKVLLAVTTQLPSGHYHLHFTTTFMLDTFRMNQRKKNSTKDEDEPVLNFEGNELTEIIKETSQIDGIGEVSEFKLLEAEKDGVAVHKKLLKPWGMVKLYEDEGIVRFNYSRWVKYLFFEYFGEILPSDEKNLIEKTGMGYTFLLTNEPFNQLITFTETADDVTLEWAIEHTLHRTD